MYSIYSHDQKLKKTEEETSKQRNLKSRQKNREILSNKYKDRMNSTLLQLNKEAENLTKPARAKTASRSDYLTQRASGSMTNQERIQQSESWQSWLDPTPCEKLSFRLRPREKSKEIQPSLKFRAKSGMERLKERISKQKEFLESSVPPNAENQLLYKDFFGTNKHLFEGGKEVMNYYHFKTHFKTIQSLALDLHSSTRNMSKAEVKKKHFDEKLGMSEKGGKNVVQEGLCIEDVMPMSSDVLEKFGMWEGKKVYHRKTLTDLR